MSREESFWWGRKRTSRVVMRSKMSSIYNCMISFQNTIYRRHTGRSILVWILVIYSAVRINYSFWYSSEINNNNIYNEGTQQYSILRNETGIIDDPTMIITNAGQSNQHETVTTSSSVVEVLPSEATTEIYTKFQPIQQQQQNVQEQQQRRPRLLIAQYSGGVGGNQNVQNYYDTLLNLTSTANQAYARMWKHDYIIFHGIPYVGEYQNESCYERIDRIIINGEKQQEPNNQFLDNIVHNNTITSNPMTTTSTTSTNTTMEPDDIECPYNYSSSRATYNKIVVLENVLYNLEFQDQYDQLLLLDSDAMIYDFSRDISLSYNDMNAKYNYNRESEEDTNTTTMFDSVFIAHKTNQSDTSTNTGSVNIGVTLWNLRNPLTHWVVKKWKYKSLSRIRRLKNDDDQGPLQSMLKLIPIEFRHRIIRGVSNNEFGYGKGKFIKHFIRPDFSNWITQGNDVKNSTALDLERIDKIRKALNDVCRKYDPICFDY